MDALLAHLCFLAPAGITHLHLLPFDLWYPRRRHSVQLEAKPSGAPSYL